MRDFLNYSVKYSKNKKPQDSFLGALIAGLAFFSEQLLGSL